MNTIKLELHDVDDIRHQLREAVIKGDVTEARMCIDIADIEELDITFVDASQGPWWGQTPLHVACMHCHYENAGDMVRTLCDLGKEHDWVNKVSSAGQTPLWMACREGNVEVVQILVEEYAADTNTYSLDRRSAMWIASFNGHAAVVQYLLLHGGNPFFKADGLDERAGIDAQEAALGAQHRDLALFVYGAMRRLLAKAGMKECPQAWFRISLHIPGLNQKDIDDAWKPIEDRHAAENAKAAAVEARRIEKLQKALEEEDRKRLDEEA